MNCERVKQNFADALLGVSSNVVSLDLEAHLRDCSACREEFESVRRLWTRLDDIAVPEPGPALRNRFYERLESYEHGMRAPRVRRGSRWSWWPQAAMAAACVSIGIFAGMSIDRPKPSGDVADLRAEVSSMRQLVALSLLQQQSASDRLRGVTWAYRVEQNDMEVLDALLRTVNQDANINVRLSAVDALRNFSDSPVARRGAMQSLAKQTSPLVQVAILDLIGEWRDRQAASYLRTFIAQPDLDPSVKKRAGELLAVYR